MSKRRSGISAMSVKASPVVSSVSATSTLVPASTAIYPLSLVISLGFIYIMLH